MRTNVATVTMTLACILTVATVAPAQERAGSVLSRLQTVEDPELGELIRVAIENRRRVYIAEPEEELKLTRDVTEAYARITLLDRQIEQTEFRYRNSTSPVRDEMMLAMAELEAKRTMELANLRQIMRITPTIAFGRRAEDELEGWYILDVVDPNAVLLHTSRKLGDRTLRSLVGVMTPAEALDYVGDRLVDPNNLPIRVDVIQAPTAIDLAEDMESRIKEMMQDSRLQMQAEVHLEPTSRRPSHLRFYVLDELIATGRHDRAGNVGYTGLVSADDVISRINQLVSLSQQLPATVDLVAEEGGEATADQLTERIVDTARQLGIADLVIVRRIAP